jgi:hypothetical protein
MRLNAAPPLLALLATADHTVTFSATLKGFCVGDCSPSLGYEAACLLLNRGPSGSEIGALTFVIDLIWCADSESMEVELLICLPGVFIDLTKHVK